MLVDAWGRGGLEDGATGAVTIPLFFNALHGDLARVDVWDLLADKPLSTIIGRAASGAAKRADLRAKIDTAIADVAVEFTLIIGLTGATQVDVVFLTQKSAVRARGVRFTAEALAARGRAGLRAHLAAAA